MKHTCILLFLLLSSILLFPQAQRISYNGVAFSDAKSTLKNSRVDIRLSVISDAENGPVLYKEMQQVNTDSNGYYHVEIGAGKPLTGKFDSIIWSIGTFFLKTETDPDRDSSFSQSHIALVRIPTDLANDYAQGTDSAKENPGYGIFHFANTRNKRPKKITVDLMTAYVNLAYPANTYPIYRHFEWCDPDRDGIGNAFVVSFSENTNNSFIEKTQKMGLVSLYPTPFQEVQVSSGTAEIVITLTKPVKVANYSETYAIKGPYKFFYFIEW